MKIFKRKKFYLSLLLIFILNLLFSLSPKVISPKAYSKGELSNKNSTETTKKVYSYLCNTYGNYILSAQQESTWMGSPDYEINYIYEASGKKPAIRGLDYMNDDFQGVNERALKYWKEGGLVTICWHCGCDFSGSWSESMNTTIGDWSSAFTKDSYQYNKLIEGMDKAAKALLELQEEGVTVLWRPFHEFDGQWFWWGKGGSSNFIKLWQMMYDRYTNYWGLNNLIWVLGYSGDVKDGWYPGDDYVDIVGADTYDSNVQSTLYNKVLDSTKTSMPVALHECGTLPKPEDFNNGSKWIWFMLWHTSYVTDSNTKEDFNKIYNDEKVITLDKLPDFNNYSTLSEDVNKDNVVDLLDLTLVANSYKCQTGDANYLKNLDINNDGIIDIIDLVKVALKFTSN